MLSEVSFLLVGGFDMGLVLLYRFFGSNLNEISAFSPLKVRLGGTLQDKVIYDVGASERSCNSFVRNASEMFGFSQGCLSMARWDQLNKFFQRTR